MKEFDVVALSSAVKVDEDAGVRAQSSERNCPFYGMHYVELSLPFLLIEQGGNECALVTDRYSPCLLELEGNEIEWRECPRVDRLILKWPSGSGRKHQRPADPTIPQGSALNKSNEALKP